ncbi:hypothetical protein ADUPG1_011083, partial [Aduncisulcus paluster]
MEELKIEQEAFIKDPLQQASSLEKVLVSIKMVSDRANEHYAHLLGLEQRSEERLTLLASVQLEVGLEDLKTETFLNKILEDLKKRAINTSAVIKGISDTFTQITQVVEKFVMKLAEEMQREEENLRKQQQMAQEKSIPASVQSQPKPSDKEEKQNVSNALASKEVKVIKAPPSPNIPSSSKQEDVSQSVGKEEENEEEARDQDNAAEDEEEDEEEAREQDNAAEDEEVEEGEVEEEVGEQDETVEDEEAEEGDDEEEVGDTDESSNVLLSSFYDSCSHTLPAPTYDSLISLFDSYVTTNMSTHMYILTGIELLAQHPRLCHWFTQWFVPKGWEGYIDMLMRLGGEEDEVVGEEEEEEEEAGEQGETAEKPRDRSASPFNHSALTGSQNDLSSSLSSLSTSGGAVLCTHIQSIKAAPSKYIGEIRRRIYGYQCMIWAAKAQAKREMKKKAREEGTDDIDIETEALLESIDMFGLRESDQIALVEAQQLLDKYLSETNDQDNAVDQDLDGMDFGDEEQMVDGDPDDYFHSSHVLSCPVDDADSMNAMLMVKENVSPCVFAEDKQLEDLSRSGCFIYNDEEEEEEEEENRAVVEEGREEQEDDDERYADAQDMITDAQDMIEIDE